MEINLKMHGTEVSIKREYDDVLISEMFDYFKTLLIGVSYSEEQFNNYIKELAEEL
jgi:hypothetical protein